MKRNYIITVIVCIVLFFSVALAAPAQDDPAETQKAEKAHQSMKKLPSSILNSMGLTPDEAAQSTRGTKLKVYLVGLDKLSTFSPGDNAKKTLVDTKETVYPVYTGKTLRTSISIRKKGGGWKNASMGGAEIHYLEPIRNAHSKANSIDIKSYFIVRVPAMYLSFLGYYKGNNLYLVPVHSHPDVAFSIGKGVPAADIYTKIKSLVGKYRDILVRNKRKK